MPKQVKDKNKSTRMMFVKEAIEKHGKCSHKEISQYVAQKIDAVASDKNFKKAIYNDLDSLIGDNIVGIEYRTRSGEIIPIGEEDDYKNKRNSFYYILGGEEETDGATLLKNSGIFFQKQKSSLPQWKVSDVKNKDQPMEDVVCLLFKSQNNYLSIETPILDLPAKIIVGSIGNKAPSLDEIESVYGNKASALLFPSDFIQPYSDNIFGQFVLSLGVNKSNDIYLGYEAITPNKKEISLVTKENLTQINVQLHLYSFWYEIKFAPKMGDYKGLNIEDFSDAILKELEKNNEDSIEDKILFMQNVYCLGKERYLAELLREKQTHNIPFGRYGQHADYAKYVELADKVGYSRINDFIHDAKANGTLYIPSITEPVTRKNKGNENTFHAKKPPSKQSKTVAKKVDISRLHATKKFQIWSSPEEREYRLPIGIRVEPDLEIYITDIYARSSYKKKAA